MEFVPPRLTGTIVGILLLALLLGAILFSIIQLATSSITALTVLWVAVVLLSLPLTLFLVYRIYGLLGARYRLDRDGFYIWWGLVYEQIPLSEVGTPQRLQTAAPSLGPGPGLWWPGCVVTRKQVEGLGQVEFFASSRRGQWILFPISEQRSLVISPRDPQAFLQTFQDATRMGSLEQIRSQSQRPDFLVSRLWSDRLARALILIGIIPPLLLLGFLALRAPALGDQIAFGFDIFGRADTFAPPGRLILLPFIGGLIWFADLALGTWMYRRESDRLIAYGLWAIPIIGGLLLWGATIQLLAAS